MERKGIVIFATNRLEATLEAIGQILPHVDKLFIAAHFNSRFEYRYPKDPSDRKELGVKKRTKGCDAEGSPHWTTPTLHKVEQRFRDECRSQKIQCLPYKFFPEERGNSTASLAASHAMHQLAAADAPGQESEKRIVVIYEGAAIPQPKELPGMFKNIRKGHFKLIRPDSHGKEDVRFSYGMR